MNISAIVMASGLSERMKENKLHMKINNKKIYQYILETIKVCSCFQQVIVVSNDEEILNNSRNSRFKTIFNGKSHLGQSMSIRLGVENSQGSDGYMFFVADQPFIKKSTIELLCSTFNDNPGKIIIPSYNGINGNPVIFPVGLKQQLLKIEGDKGGKTVITKNSDKIIKLYIETNDEYFDIDTKDDYDKVIKMKVIGCMEK